MKQMVLCVFSIACFVWNSFASPGNSLEALARAIKQAPQYDAAKDARIETLKNSLHTAAASPIAAFELNEQLYEEYKLFNFDSAYLYAGKMRQLAGALNDAARINLAQQKYAFIMLSAGLYKETQDTLQSIRLAGCPDSLKASYYTLMARYYYDLASYDFDKYHSVSYDITGSHYMDSALAYYPASSFEKAYYNGLKLFKQANNAAAASFFEQLLANPQLTSHQLALTASTLSGIYLATGNNTRAIELLTQAAITDIQSSTKEVFAIYNLAELLYKKGDIKYASLCVENAIANAEFYGARQRKAQVSGILSLIESERIQAVEAQRRLAIGYGIAITLFVGILIALIVVIRKQIRKLQAAKKIITEAHGLQQLINGKLEEANKIKEEYIGYFFKLDSEYFARLEKIKKTLEQKLADRKYDDIRFIVNNIQPKKEKEELLRNFDKVFLRIFPHFVSSFNALFKEEDQVKLPENQLLNTDLRIFALMRIGITDNDKIAEILEYAVTTIYAYKTRIKNRSIVANDDFEKRVMEIQSI